MSKTLTLFTNTYPYGSGETFLDNEIPYLAERFDHINIFPLYNPSNNISNRCIEKYPNISICKTLMPFDHKDKYELVKNGIWGLNNLWQVKEYIANNVLFSGNKNWLFFNYAFIHNSILNNKEVYQDILNCLSKSDIAYFYWGDKSALIIPEIKKELKHINPNLKYVVRFHGTDLYEEVKGYLPFRSHLFPSIDYAVTISNNGKQYLKTSYKHLPKNIVTFRLGSENKTEFNNKPIPSIFHIASCSNVIPLKRLDLIAKALNLIEKDIRFIERMKENGYDKIKWSHLGDGPLLEGIKNLVTKNDSVVITNFKGRVNHDTVLESYKNSNCSLFIQVSTSEGIPVSIMEALSFGIPIMATNVGGVSEILENGDYGVLLDKNIDEKILAENIKRLILMPQEALAQMKIAARKEWESNWNGDKNFAAFAEYLSKL